MTLCPSCGASNREGRKFCAECGSAFSAACQACGAANQPGERFCGECGAPLSPGAMAGVAPAAPVHEAPSAERRLVSVLFADLVGHTSFSEGRDAEDVRELLTRCRFASVGVVVALNSVTLALTIAVAASLRW